MNVIICGPAQGTEEEPYRCICCLRTFSDIEQLAVSLCWDCSFMGLPGCVGCGKSRILTDVEAQDLPERELGDDVR